MEEITIAHIERIIKESVTLSNLSLEKTINQICHQIGCERLDDTNSAFIERIYIKECCGAWINDISNKSFQEKSIGILYEFINSEENSLQIIPKTFKDSFFFQLLRDTTFFECYGERFCKTLRKLRGKCLDFLKKFNRNIEFEINFVNLISDYLFEKNLNSKTLISLKVVSYLNSEISFFYFLKNALHVLNSEKVGNSNQEKQSSHEINFENDNILDVEKKLEQYEKTGKIDLDLLTVTKILSNMNAFVLESKIKEYIAKCLKDDEIKIVTIDGRKVMEVVGQCVILSKNVDKIESSLTTQTCARMSNLVENDEKPTTSKSEFASPSGNKGPDLENEISEVRFICGRSLTIDVDLTNDKWHGKNIVVLTKKINIERECTWDVSGLPGVNDFSASAKSATNVNEIGEDGIDGFCGESGGNILLEAESISNKNMLKLISNGGNGASGQNGGNGYNGRNGVGIKFEDFKKEFKINLFSISSSVFNRSGKESNNIVKVFNGSKSDGFREGRTDMGQYIIHSLGKNKWYATEMYTIYKGSVGEKATQGGRGGCGGMGGFEGNVEVCSNISEEILIENLEGKHGNDGEGGQNGIPGKDGHDVAHTYQELFSNVKWYGANEDSKLDLSYHDDSGSNRVLCNKHKKYIQIRERKIPIQSSVSHKNNEKMQMRKHHTMATRQKSISKSTIKSQYAKYLKTNCFSIDKKVSQYELEKMTKHIEHSSQLSVNSSTSTNVWHQVKYRNRRNDKAVKNSTKLMEISNNNFQLFDSILSLDDTSRNEESYLRQVELLFKFVKLQNCDDEGIKEINKKFKELCSSLQTNYEIKDHLKVNNLLLQKMKLKMIDEVENNLIKNIFTTLKSNKTITDENFDVVQLESVQKEFYNSFDNSELGYITNFFESENKVSLKKAIEYFKSLKIGISNLFVLYSECLIQFILNIEESDKNDVIFEYQTVFFKFYKKKEKKVKSTMSALYKQVQKFNDDPKKQYEILLKENLETNCVEIVRKTSEINQINFNDTELKNLEDLYDIEKSLKRHEKEVKSIFDWDKYIKSDVTINRFEKHVMAEGVNSDLFVVLLCEIYNVSIKMYTPKENYVNEYDLCKIYKSKSNDCLHILRTDDKFQFMKSNDDIVLFKINQIHRNLIVGNILLDVAGLESLESFESYVAYQTYTEMENLRNHYLSKFRKYPLSENLFIERILNFVTEESKKEFENKLKMFCSDIIGDNMLLYFLSLKLESEGLTISESALFLLINVIFISVADLNYNVLDMFTWIFASHFQVEWLGETLSFIIGQKFRCNSVTMKNLRKPLKIISDERVLICLHHKLLEKSFNLLMLQDILDTVHLLSKTIKYFNADDFININFSEWKHYLWEFFWQSKIESIFAVSEEVVKNAVFHLTVIQNNYGTQQIKELFDSLTLNSDRKNYEDFSVLLHSIVNGDRDVIFFTEKLKNGIHLSKVISSKNLNIYRSDVELMHIISSNSNNSETIRSQCNNISKFLIEVKNIKKNHKFIITDFIIDTNNDIDETEIRETINYMQETSVGEYKDVKQLKIILTIVKIYYKQNILDGIFDRELLALIDQAIFITRGFRLRYTQLVAIASLLLNEKNTLAQVNTGEGKSLIVVALALLKALRNEQVDIITCSRLLAIRDAESEPPKGYKDIYNLFGINVSHNCSEQLELRTNAYSANQVIYGEIGNFQRDYLLDRFYGKNVMGDRNFKNIIVDEVDSMLLDKGNNILYLSQNIPMFDKLEPVLLYIWQIVNSVDSDNYNEDYIKRRVISEISPTIDINSFRVLDKNLTETDLRKLWSLLKQNKIINEFGNIIVKENISVVIKSALNLDYPHLIPRTIYLFQYKLITDGNLKIPEYLKPFVLLHVDSWVENAITALLMIEGTDYVVDVDRSNSSPDINPIVTIIDNDTGTDFSNSQWENGLHQFLQMKHGCRLSPMSLKSVFISNVTYFKLYHKMHGLSGTLGSEVEREYLKEIHNVDFISVPTARRKRYEEYTPIVSNTCDEWKNNVFGRCMAVVKEQNRSALIICENIATAENMYTHFKNRLNGTDHQIKLHLYKRDYEEFQFAQGNVPLDTGHVIIATNLAGRGTDIKLSELLVKNGGLHVCVTYLPPNVRVEHQAFGRVSRSGEPGSSQLVILNENNNGTNIIKLKIERSKNEVKNTMLTKSHYQNITKTEESLFETFKDQYRYLKEKVYENQHKFKSKNYTEISNLILNESLNIWAFWLDKTSTETKNNCNGATSDLVKRFECFEKKFSNILYINPLHWNQIFNDEFDSYNDINPTLLIKIAKVLSNMSKEKLAVIVFEHVIKLEPHFCEVAHYYAAYAILKDRKWNDLNKSEDGKYSQAVGHLNAADVLFQDRKRFCMQFAATAAEIEQRVHAREVQIIKIDALKKQKSKEFASYDIFLDSIKRILGRPISSNDLEIDKIDENLAKEMYDFLVSNDMIENMKLRKDEIKKYKSKLQLICSTLNVDHKKLMDLLGNLDDNFSINDYSEKLIDIIPNRREFWNLLWESKLISVNLQNLKMIDPLLETTIQKMLSSQTLTLVNTEELKNCNINYTPSSGDTDIKLLLKHEFTSCIKIKRFERKVRRHPNIFKNIETIHLSQTAKETSELHKSAVLQTIVKQKKFFSKYDFIFETNFVDSDIDEHSAKEIFKELVKANIIIQDVNYTGMYRLGINSNSLFEAVQSVDSLYASEIYNILKYNFAYRIALEDLEMQLSEYEKLEILEIKLPLNPQEILLHNLIGNDFFIPSKVVANKIEEVTEVLQRKYPDNLSSIQIVKLFNSNGINASDVNSKHLISEMVKKEWIEPKVGITELSTYFSAINYEELYYYFAKFEITGNFKKSLSVLESEQEKMKSILHRHKLASNTHIHTAIKNIMSNTMPVANIYEAFKFKLDNITDLRCDNYNDDDISSFVLNALCHIISVDEKLWTWKTIWSAAAVIGIGGIELLASIYFIANPFLSKTFVSEGVNDIIYGIQALWCGKFNWYDYGKHKIYSVITSAAISGVVCYFTSFAGINLPSNTFDPGIQKGAEKISEMTGNKIISFAGEQMIRKEALKMIGKHVGSRVMDFAITITVEKITTIYVQPFCEKLLNVILTKLNDSFKFDESVNFTNLNKFCAVFGLDKAMEIFRRYVSETLNVNTLESTLSSYCSTIVGHVRTTMSQVGRNCHFATFIIDTIDLIDTFWKQKFIITQIKNVTTLINKFKRIVGNINQKIEQDIASYKDSQTSSVISEEERKNFQTNAMEFLKKTYINEITKYIRTEIVQPILKYILQRLTNASIEFLKDKYVKYKDNKVKKEFNRLKENYERKKEDSTISEEQKVALRKEYDNSMINLMKKTRNPGIYAAIIREKVPMDRICVEVSHRLIASLPELKGKKIKFILRTNEMEQEFCNDANSDDAIVIDLEVINNHFAAGGDVPENNCSIAAIRNQLEEQGIQISLSDNEFRNKVADFIETNDDVRHCIENGWHELAISKGAIGGAARYKVLNLTDEEKTQRIVKILREESSRTKLRHERKINDNGTKYATIIETTLDDSRERCEYSHEIVCQAVEIFERERGVLDTNDTLKNNYTKIYKFNPIESENGPCYVGKAKNVKTRLYKHESDLRHSKENYLPADYAKEKGIYNFKELYNTKVIAIVKNKQNVRNIEAIYQNRHNALGHTGGLSKH